VDFFMPPVSKGGEPIFDEGTHMTCYGLVPATPFGPLDLTVDNQFGPQPITVFDARALCVPTDKLDDAIVPSAVRDHYKCYQASGFPVFTTKTLVDQFETENVTVLDPVMFCNPVVKDVGGDITPISDPTQHLTCYAIDPPGTTPGTKTIRNQFHQAAIDVFPSFALCVPSLKTIVCGRQLEPGVCIAGPCPPGLTCKPDPDPFSRFCTCQP
jgi:hypothetical protein